MLELNPDLAAIVLKQKADETLKMLEKRFQDNKESYIKDFDSLPVFIQNVIEQQLAADPTFCLTNIGAFIFAAKDGVNLAEQFSSLREWNEGLATEGALLKGKTISDKHSQETLQLTCAFCEQILKTTKPGLVIAQDIPDMPAPNLRLLK